MSDPATGETYTLVSMVDYQDGAVVSRTLVKKEKGTITAFAFDQGQGLSEHTAPFDAMVQVLEGSVNITISGKECTVSTGEMIVLPADEPHSLKAPERFKMLLTMIRA